MTITEDDTSVLEMVATLKEYRRKGYASALISRALMDLQQKGIKTISLRAEADGVGVYKKLGFKECFKRIVASCDWNNIYKEGCPCYMEIEKIEKAKQIFNETNDVKGFVSEMKKQDVIGKDISYEPQENAIYITKRYACDCGGGNSSNNTMIGQRCHCEYVNYLTQYVPISYCKCSALWFEPMFVPIFGDKIKIEPVKTVISGADECVFRVKL
jgi:predicted GNAT family acetyltransferase